MNKLNEQLEAAIGEHLGTKEVHIMQVSPAFEKIPYVRLTASWDIPINFTALHMEHNGLTAAIGELIRAISDRVSIGAIQEARAEITKLKSEIDDLNQAVNLLVPYKNYAEVAKEINGVKK